MAFLFPFVDWNSTNIFGVAILVAVAAALLTGSLEGWLRFLLGKLGTATNDQDKEKLISNSEDIILLSSRIELLSAKTSRDVIVSFMKSGMEFLAASGVSFVSFEEWGSPLWPISLGDIPLGITETWQNILANPETRQACRKCTTRETEADCVLNQNTRQTPAKILCVPLHNGRKELGVANFFFKMPTVIDEKKRAVIASLASDSESALLRITERAIESDILERIRYSEKRDISRKFIVDLCRLVNTTVNAEVTAIWLAQTKEKDSPWIAYPPFGDEEDGLGAFPVSELWQLSNANRKPYEYVLTSSLHSSKSVLVFPMQFEGDGIVGMMMVVGPGEQQNIRLLSPYLSIVATEIAALIHFDGSREKEVYDAIVDERYRLAREIHDGIAQTLAFLKIQTAQMVSYLNTGKMDRLETVLSANYQTLTEAFQDARLAIENLRVTPEADTRSWLKDLAQDFTVTTGIPVDVTNVPDGIELPLSVQAQLVRIIQEALNNVRKHSKATSVVITSRVEGDDIVIEVIDDGLGFESELAGGDSKFGLVGMRERADMIDGDFQVISRSGEGTTVRLVIPHRNIDASTGA